MTTLEIPRAEWMTFFDTLSRLHADEPIRIEVMRIDFGAQLEASDMPLDGFGADVRPGAATITIAAGSEPNRHIAHLISDPLHVRLLRGPGGDDEVLEIEAADESVTLVYFERPKGWSPRPAA
jgi:hypothetical protein